MNAIFKRFMPALLALVVFALCPASFAATYYVSSIRGDDSNSGLSPNDPWRSLNPVNRLVRGTGDDVRLESGSVFHDQMLQVDWGGTSSDWVNVDCFRMVQGKVAECRDVDPKPEINGTFDEQCISRGTCIHDGPGAIPESSWQALVAIRSSYVSLRQLAVHDSAGIPIGVRARKGSPALHDFVLEDIDVHRTTRFIVLIDNSTRGVVRRLEGSQFNLCDYHRMAACSNPGWPGGITITNSTPAHVLFEDNYVHEGYGEGFNCLRASHVIMRKNRVGNIRSNGFYMDNCSNAIVENNIAWGDKDLRWRHDYGFAGVAMGNEDYPSGARDTKDIVIRNNFVVGFAWCMWASQFEQSREAGKKIGFHAYGNTCVAQRKQGLWVSPSVGVRNIEDIVVENNIFYSEGLASQCDAANSAKVRFNYNMWSSGQRAEACRGQNDVIGDPMLKASLTQFFNMDVNNPPRPADFGVAGRSPAIRAGNSAVVTRRVISVSDAEFFGLGEDGKCTAGVGALATDYHCVTRQSPPTMGAVDRSSYPPKPPVLSASG